MSNVASEIIMALNVVNDAQQELGMDGNPKVFGILEHARGHLLKAWEMTDKITGTGMCTIGNYGFEIARLFFTKKV